MRVYLSGPITGVENYRENFRNAAERLRADGIMDIINPAELCEVLPLESATWEEYLSIDMHLIDLAQCLVLLPGWRESKGAQREYGYALAKDLMILEMDE